MDAKFDLTTTRSSSSSAPAPAAARSQMSSRKRASRSSCSRPATRHEIAGLRQRRMGELHPARLVGHAHHVGKLAGAPGLPEPAGLDRQGGRRLDRALGRRVAALRGARVQGQERSMATSRRQPARLADHAREIEPYYAKAEDKMGVTRTNGIPGLPGNNNFKVLAAGARKVGYKEVHTGRMSINSQPRDGRGACQQIGFCFQGCKSGAKWSTLYTEIPKGEETGNLEVRPNSTAVRIEHDAAGKVDGVVYVDKDGKTAETEGPRRRGRRKFDGKPAPAANSHSGKFPNGLANSSGQVGRNYMRHMTG